MIHKLAIGHFDTEALKARTLLVVRPLDMSVVTRVLREVGQLDENGRTLLGGHPVEFRDGYVICPWLLAERVLATEEFARRLEQETGCILYDLARREAVTLGELAGW